MTATTAVTMKRSVWFEDSTDAGREPIPAGLDEITPGPVLAALLSTIDVSTLSGYDRVTVLKAHQRMASHYSGAVLDGIAAIADEYEDTDLGFRGELDPLRGTSAEVRTALHLTRRAADDALALALHLRDRLPRVRTWLLRGDIDVLRARVIADGTEHLSPSAARRVVEALAERVHRLTTGQLRARIRSLAIEIDPDEASDRYAHAVADRYIRMQPTEAGTAHLFAFDLPPDALAEALANVDRLAKSLRHDDETRTIDQLRADTLLDLLRGNATATDLRSPTRAPRSGTIDIRVDLTTLVGLDQSPADLGGYGPVIAEVARRVAEDHPELEHRITVDDVDRDRRRTFTVKQRRELESSQPTCVFPGCRMPAGDCDIDHIKPGSEGGRTMTANGAPLCRHDHVNRHGGWTYVRLPDGSFRWTSPLGHISTTDPP